jgi:hypothetical protein
MKICSRLALFLAASISVVPATYASDLATIENKVKISEAFSANLIAEVPKVETNSLSLTSGTELYGNIADVATSVSQLSDVKPTDWAFTALQSLVERYGCIAGFPDRSYRGSQGITRYEFAAGLNACLDKVNELISSGLADKVGKEDLANLQKLQETFSSELATIKGSVTALEAKVATLEAQQFSTTTKLTVQAFLNLTGAGASSPVRAERNAANPGSSLPAPTRGVGGVPSSVLRNNPNVTFSYYAFINFNTSFTGKDQLVTQLALGNGNSPANEFVSSGFFNSFGTPFTDQSGVVTPGSIVLRELFYNFPITDSIQIAIGPRLNFYRYFDANRFTFYLTGAGSFNSSGSTLVNAVDRGAGAVATWKINDQFRLAVGYLAENTEFLNPAAGFNISSNPAVGLFAPTNTITAELTYSPSRDANIRLLYTRASLRATNGFIGGSAGEPVPYGFIDDGFGGTLRDTGSDTFVFNFDWLVIKGFGLFGRYSYGNIEVKPTNISRQGGNVSVQSIQLGLAFPDLGKEGALGTLSFVMPNQLLSGRNFLLSGGGDGATQYETELTYFYPLSRNIAIVPAVYAIFNPNSFSNNPTVFVGNMRMQFTF